MAKKEVKEFTVDGKKITCPVCEHDRFWTRRTLMNTRGASFLSFDWLNLDALNKICNNCGYVFWFYRQRMDG